MSRRNKILAAALLAVFAALLPFDSYAANIADIFISGNSTVPADSIAGTIKSKKGGLYSRETVREDIKSLWKLGQFQDISVDKIDVAGGVILTYNVVEKPLIVSISFKGNKKLKKDDLEKDLSITLYRPLSEKNLADSINKIKESYAKKGYYLADIDYDLVMKEGNEAELVFTVFENKGAIIRKVEFIGNHAFKDKDLKNIIRTKEKTIFSWMSSGGKFKPEQLEQDVVLLQFHYLSNGYLKSSVANPKIAISKDKRYIYITYYVEEGKQYKISDIDVDGEVLTTKEEIKSLLSVKPKEIYNHRKVEEDMQKIVDFYGESGYAFVNVRPSTQPNDEDLTTPLVFLIEKGPRIRVERINISGNTTTRDKVVRRELKVKEGDIYNTRLVNESRERLMQTGFFEEVNFATPRGSTDDSLVLNVTVKEKPTGSFNIGAGFSTAENFIFSASIAKENFFGYGIGGQISAEISSIRQQFMLEYRDPYFLDTEWMFNGSAYRSVYQYIDFNRSSYGGSLGIGHRIFDHSSISLGYQVEQVEVDDFAAVVPAYFREDASGLTSELILNVARDTRDNRLFPKKGTFFAVDNEFAGSKLGGDNNFYRVSGNARAYYPLFWGIIAKANAKIGYIKSLNDKSVPLFERYFTGGVYSLRGFEPRSIGPRIQIPGSPSGPDQEFIYGGDKLLVFNGELEFPIYDPAGLRWVFFMDAGNAFAETENYSLTNLRSNWGLGIRWVSPIGPLRFEWGVPFNRKPGEDATVFNFTIGSLF